MNYAFSANAFRNFSFEEAARAIARAGFPGMEIMCDTPHAWPRDLDDAGIGRIKKSLQDNNLAISNLNAFMMCAVRDFHHPSWIEADPDYRQIRIDYTLECLELADKLGARCISTEPGGPVEGLSEEEALALFVQGIETVLPRAEALGIHLLVEPEPDLLLETSDDFLAFADHFSSPYLGLNLDVGHFYCVGEDPVEVIGKLKDHTVHIHLEDINGAREHCHLQLGHGAMDIPGIINRIRNTGYDGFVTVELYPFVADPATTAEQARLYLDRECGHG